jgi:sialate O-acetylesterase
MVLQRDKPVVVWGWATPRATISVALDAQRASATASATGEWSVALPAQHAGGPHTLTIASGTERIALSDVLVGDVWVASGQSNMEFTLDRALDAPREIAAANDAMLRQFKIPTSWSNDPSAELAGGIWASADPAHAGQFSAVGYYFARSLRASEKVPIGIINTTWGGSNIETWISRPALGMSDAAWRDMQRTSAARAESTLTVLRTKVGALPTAAAAKANVAIWSSADFNDASWGMMPVPAYWEAHGYDGMDGVAWYRTSFELSATEAAAGVTLQIAAIDDDDIAWVNGTEIGRTTGYNVVRSYRIPPSALHAGRNVLALRVTDGGGGGGINGAVSLRKADGTATSLAGNWKFAVEQLSFAEDGQVINKVPSVLFNKMVHPILRFRVKGFIWYQGESNANNVAQAQAYKTQFATLITSWRGAWAPSRDTLPFLWVQLPNYGTPAVTPPASSAWATQRESMDAALALPKTGRAIAIDVGEAGDIHPRNKRDPGERLALVAQRVAYGRAVHDAGPSLRRMSVRGDTIDIQFTVAGGSLVSRSSSDSTVGVAIAGADRQFAWARARVRGSHLLVWSERVHAPVAVRYAWSDSPPFTALFDSAGLPAAPFRSDRW